MSQPTQPSRPRGTAKLNPATAVWLVARREFVTKVRTKAFVIGTVAIIVVIAAYVLFVGFMADRESTTTVAFTPDAAALAESLAGAGDAVGEDIELDEVADTAAGERAVRDGDADVLLTRAGDGTGLVGERDVPDRLPGLLDGVLRAEVLNDQLAVAGADPAEVAAALAATKPDVRTLEPSDPDRGQRLGLAFGVTVLLYGSLVFVGQFVAQGVVEEKSSRVVELLLSALRPWQLLLGKVIGLGTVGLLQLLIIGGLGLGAATALDVLTIPGAITGVLAATVLWYLLGMLLFATVYAAVAALVSRQEELAAVTTPVTMVLVAVFAFGLTVLQSADSTLTVVLSMVPPLSPILMPARMALGEAPAWQVVTGVGLTVLGTAGLTWLAGRIYANAVLRTGARVRVRDALRA